MKLDEENEKIIAELKYSGDTSAIENIAFPTWTEENGQDDIIWEVASQVDSSTWRAEILLKNYDYAKGIYNVHAYAYFKDGTYECAGTEALDVQVDPKGILKISVNNHAQIEAVLSNVKNADEVDHVAFRFGQKRTVRMILYGILQIKTAMAHTVQSLIRRTIIMNQDCIMFMHIHTINLIMQHS